MSLSAAIDIGSNTIRLLIGDVRDNRIEHVYSDRKITRLAEGIGKIKRLRDENIEASIRVLKHYSSVIQEHGILSVGAVATGAIREVSNADTFIRKAFTNAGVAIEVISGEKEAELILKGVLSSLFDSLPIARNQIFIVDIGGGSTEWIVWREKRLLDMGSIPIGVVKLHEKCVKTDPISKADITELDKEILPMLEMLKERIGHPLETKTTFIGTAGTFTTLAAIDLRLKNYSREKIHLHRISLPRLLNMSRSLLALSLKERIKVAGIEPGRADLIIPGIQFTINIMKTLQFDELIISDYGLLEGVLIETVERK